MEVAEFQRDHQIEASFSRVTQALFALDTEFGGSFGEASEGDIIVGRLPSLPWAMSSATPSPLTRYFQGACERYL